MSYRVDLKRPPLAEPKLGRHHVPEPNIGVGLKFAPVGPGQHVNTSDTAERHTRVLALLAYSSTHYGGGHLWSKLISA